MATSIQLFCAQKKCRFLKSGNSSTKQIIAGLGEIALRHAPWEENYPSFGEANLRGHTRARTHARARTHTHREKKGVTVERRRPRPRRPRACPRPRPRRRKRLFSCPLFVGDCMLHGKGEGNNFLSHTRTLAPTFFFREYKRAV